MSDILSLNREQANYNIIFEQFAREFKSVTDIL